ncbi:T9SS type A sorting domain-containing protein [bacterium]|nr:T9SS type A sorting domain-containing protein [bacterium]
MKKGLLFVGLIIAMTLLCCYALVAADAVTKKMYNVTTNTSKAVSNKIALPQQAPAMAFSSEPTVITNETVAIVSDPQVDELYLRILDLKSQGLYDPDLWDEYHNSISRPQRPTRHMDEGGETCGSATVVTALPYNDSGYTCDNANDHALVGTWGPHCDYNDPNNAAPDVVYVYSPAAAVTVTIDLSNSGYDTKLWVYDGSCVEANIIACDDDGGSGYQSKIISLTLTGGHDYYIIVDGYGTDCGNYVINITCDAEPAPMVCPDNTLFGQEPDHPTDDWVAAVSDTDFPYLRADDFSGVTLPIEDIHFWGLSVDASINDCSEEPMNFEIKFYQDASGFPGTVVSTYNVSLNRQETGLRYHSSYQLPLYYWSATLNPPCTMTSGWVSIQGTSTASPNCRFWWISSGEQGGGFCVGKEPGGSWTPSDYYQNLAFCLTGEAEMYGACCDPATGNCTDDVPASQCQAPFIFYPGQTCAEIDCEPPNCQPCEEAFVMDGYSYTNSDNTCYWNGMDQTCIWGADFIWSDGCYNSDAYYNSYKHWYTFTLECVSTVDITVTPTAGNDPQLALVDCCPTLDGEEDMTDCCVSSVDVYLDGEPENINIELQPGTYYIEVIGHWDGCGPYELTVTSSDCPLPIELTTLEAVAGDRQITLSWVTASETNNDHFDIQRRTDSDWITVGAVQGTNNVTGSNYQYVDRAVVNGVSYTYRLRSYDINGAVHEYDLTTQATPEAPIPVEYALDQNFPNPFNPNTTISYALKDAGFVTLKVYNLLGQEVATLVAGEFTAGRYTATFMATDLPSGVYIYRLDVNDFTATKKMVLMK